MGIANATPGQRAEDTFTAFYRHRYAATIRLAWLLTSDPSQCEDAVQDAFTRVHARWADVTDPAAYLRTAVVNGFRDRARRRGREERRLRLTRPLVDVVDPQDLVLLDAVAHLRYRQRAAVVLRYWADLPDGEGMGREATLALVESLSGSPGAYAAPSGFREAETTAAETARESVGDATVVARGSDPAWPEAVCLESDGLTRCFRNLQSPDNSPTAVVDSVILDGWWLVGFAQGGLSEQSGLTTDAGTATLHWTRRGDVEWFAVRLPDAATWAQGEISSSSGSGYGGPWFRP